jgi:hypothetical protein
LSFPLDKGVISAAYELSPRHRAVVRRAGSQNLQRRDTVARIPVPGRRDDRASRRSTDKKYPPRTSRQVP